MRESAYFMVMHACSFMCMAGFFDNVSDNYIWAIIELGRLALCIECCGGDEFMGCPIAYIHSLTHHTPPLTHSLTHYTAGMVHLSSNRYEEVCLAPDQGVLLPTAHKRR